MKRPGTPWQPAEPQTLNEYLDHRYAASSTGGWPCAETISLAELLRINPNVNAELRANSIRKQFEARDHARDSAGAGGGV